MLYHGDNKLRTLASGGPGPLAWLPLCITLVLGPYDPTRGHWALAGSRLGC